MQPFELHTNFEQNSFIIDLLLCKILLVDRLHYPWILLIPRRANVTKMIDLPLAEQWQLMQEMNLAQKIMWQLFSPTQLNVAAIGNKTPQLHVHIIARNINDPAWPETVWDHPQQVRCEDKMKRERLQLLQKAFLDNK